MTNYQKYGILDYGDPQREVRKWMRRVLEGEAAELSQSEVDDAVGKWFGGAPGLAISKRDFYYTQLGQRAAAVLWPAVEFQQGLVMEGEEWASHLFKIALYFSLIFWLRNNSQSLHRIRVPRGCDFFFIQYRHCFHPRS